jgi:glycosyltransferase involved in cell wall biosynthesis
MYKGKSVAVVVPAYNEERLITVTLDAMPEWVDRVVVVDDASTDATAGRVEAWSRDHPGDRLVFLRHETNQGVGGAIATGYQWVRDHGGDVTVVMAGDAQMDPADLSALLDPVVEGRADYAKGNRLFTGDAWKVIPRVRYLGNSVLSLLTKIASGYWHVADSQCGYAAIGRRALETLDWSRTYRRFGQPNDLLVRLNVYNFRVVDVPVRPVYGIGETSGIRPLRMIPGLSLLLLRLFLHRMTQKYVIRDFHPLVFFYLLGFLLYVPGLLLGLYLVVYRLLVGPVAVTSALFAVFLFVSGLQSILFAMWFDMEYVRQDR